MSNPIRDQDIKNLVDFIKAAEIVSKKLRVTVWKAAEIMLRSAQSLEKIGIKEDLDSLVNLTLGIKQ